MTNVIGEAHNKPEVLNQRAVNVLNRVSNKLTGKDFKPDHELDVHHQVEKLIQQATSLENLCQCYIGMYSQNSEVIFSDLYRMVFVLVNGGGTCHVYVCALWIFG